GSGPVFDYLAEEFSGLQALANTSHPHLEIELVDVLPIAPQGATLTKEYIGWGNGFQHLTGDLRYQFERLADVYRLSLDISTHQTRPGDSLRRFLDLNFLSRPQTLAKNFMYNAFNLVTGILHAQLG